MKESQIADIKAHIWDIINQMDKTIGRDGTDDKNILSAYEHLKEAATSINKAGSDEEKKKPFSVYRTIRIDGEFDTSKHDSVDEAVSDAVAKVINDANAHNHTIDNGIQITEIIDCGDAV